MNNSEKFNGISEMENETGDEQKSISAVRNILEMTYRAN